MVWIHDGKPQTLLDVFFVVLILRPKRISFAVSFLHNCGHRCPSSGVRKRITSLPQVPPIMPMAFGVFPIDKMAYPIPRRIRCMVSSKIRLLTTAMVSLGSAWVRDRSVARQSEHLISIGGAGPCS
ncbi:hypothetical protein ZHAS_00005843 [Anopheles sinensis]|uniref:Uncharacterized protein n=1 Tax=Anopheles sinensis TaxID=74873 RepID=A0A084VKS0_ANOSI|nr:hypothetical protein ZHAS_00005843 [Anopheles sinensis]